MTRPISEGGPTRVGLYRCVFEAIEASNGSTERLLLAAGLRPDVFDSPDAHVGERLLWSFCEQVALTLGNPCLGLTLGKEVRFDDMGAGIERRLAQSLTLFDAIKTYSKAKRNFSRDRIWVAQGEKVSWFLHKSSGGLTVSSRHAEPALLFVMTKIIRLAAGQDWRPREVRLQTAPQRQFCESDTFCDAEVRFGNSATAIALPTRLLSTCVRGGDGSSSSREARWLELFRSEGREALAYGVPTIETAAEMLGTSPRTLQRRLAEEGLTYVRFVDQLRFDRALTMVEGSDASIGEIARLVGYSGAPHFSRAFRRWTGTNCQAIRNRLVSE